MKSILIIIGILLFVTACTQNGPVPSTPTADQGEVATFVAQTLAALAQGGVTATPSPAPVIAQSASITPAAPSETPQGGAGATPQGGAGATSQPATLAPTSQPVSPTATPAPASPNATSTPQATPAPTLTTVPTSSALTPTAAVTASPSVPVTGSCIDKAGFFGDVTIPDDTLLKMNESFVKTWRVRNEGTCTWGGGYQLVFGGGSNLNGPLATSMPSAAPGDIISISVSLKAPAQGGTYVSDWQFQNPSGARFGVNSGGQDYIWAKILVDWGPGVGPTATPPPVGCAYGRNAAYESQILSLINDARTKHNPPLPPLTLQSQLSAAALGHSADMACNNFIDHAGSDGSTWYTRVKAAGYAYSYASENIYVGDPNFGGDAQGAFTWWMNSQVHRDNILSNKITQIGIGYAYYAQSLYGGYYTLDFARP
jgi:uncharacterized protein YkwD